MRLGVRIFVWLSAALLLLGTTAATFAAVTDADIAYLKNKVASGQALTTADIKLAEEINATTTSHIDLNAELERAKRAQMGYVDQVRPPRNTLDVYQWTETDFEWQDISELGAALTNGDDSNQGPFELGFTFTYYDQPYTSVRVCTNGFITFNSTATDYTNDPIPNTVLPNAAIYPFWDDFNTTPGGQIRYYSDPGRGQFIVSWIGVPHHYFPANPQHPYTFQVVLNSNGTILLNYQTVQTDTIPGDTSCTVGIENGTGSEGIQICYNGTGTLPQSGHSFLISLPNGVPNPVENMLATQAGTDVVLTWNDPRFDTNGNEMTPDSIVISLGAERLGAVEAGVETFTHLNAPEGNLTYYAVAWNEGFSSVPASASIVIGNAGYFSDFEANDGGWESDGGWEHGTPSGEGPGGAHSGNNCWGTIIAGNYANGACYNLDLNMGLVVMEATATVEYWAWFDTEANFDGCNFKVSVDGGSTWTIVEPEGGYPGSTNTSNDCNPSQPAWTGHDIGEMWHYVVIPVGQFVSQAPIFRFQFGSDGSVQYPGYYIDDLIMWGIALPSGMPRPVTNLVGTYTAPNAVLTWTDPTLDTDGNPIQLENVEVWMGPVVTGTLLATVPAGVQTYTHASPPFGVYTYNVRPYNDPYYGLPASVDVIVGTPTYVEGFEVSDGAWIPDPETGGWEWGTPSGEGPGGAHNGTNCWGTVLGGEYENSACYNLDLNLGLVVESPTATVEFWAWYDTEESFDGCHFKVSIDDGATWTVVEPENGYPQDAVFSNPCIGEDTPCWAGNSGGWIYLVVPVGAFIGEAPIFRLTFGSDGSVQYPGFYFDDVIIWGLQQPVFTTVSGTVTLNGGTGNVTNVTVRANGIGNPSTHPAANGTYTITQVVAGDRIITGELTGYVSEHLPLTVPEGGVTDFNIMLDRDPPPAPTALTGTVDEDGLVSLNWADSPDTEVDRWYIYRKLRHQDEWLFQNSVTTSEGTNQLPMPGIWNFAVTAVDSVGPLEPVESELSNQLEFLYGELPPSGLVADGNYDDRIHLSWWRPGVPPETELFYDDDENDVDGLGWWSGTPTFGWMVAHFQGNGPVTVTRLKFWFTSFTGIGDPIQVGLFADDGTGMPTFTPLGVVDAVQGDEPLDAWREFEIEPPLTFNDGSFYVGARQIAALSPIAIGGDEDNPFVNNTFYYSYTGDAWTAFEPNLLTIPMSRCFAIGDFGQRIEMSPAPLVRNATRSQVAETAWNQVVTSVTTEKVDAAALARLATPAVSREPSAEYLAGLADRRYNATGPRAPHAEAANPEDRGGNNSLDQVVQYYIVYRDNVDIAHVDSSLQVYDNFVSEGIEYDYHVTAHYDNSVESPGTDTVSAMAAMPPAAPGGVDGLTLNSTQIRIVWTDPILNADGTNCVDLTGFNVYRDNVLLGSVAPGVGEYTDTPPQSNLTYTWAVKAYDEIPNEGPAGTFSGSVVDPYMEVEYAWVDITTTGTPAGITGDDENVGPFPLGFDFNFYGNTFNSVRICGNGFASFTSTATAFTNTTIPNVNEPNNLLAVFWDDMYPPDGGTILYYADAANQRFIISWEGIQHISGTEPYTYQIIIGASGSVTYQYHTIPTTTPSNTSSTIGVENATGTDGLMVWNNGAGDFTPVSESAVQFWGPPPVYANVSGTVTLDGLGGTVANANVSANGVTHPTVHPNTSGVYTLQDVQVGNRTFTVSLTGYHTVTQAIAVPVGGLTNQNFTLRRENPPAPTGLAGTANGTGLVTLNWDDSPDLQVDQYKLYRKTRADETWTMIQTIVGRTNSQATDQLTVGGIYQYQVTAVDIDVIAPPVESDPSAMIEVPYGALPPQMLTANGNFDNKIRLAWLNPLASPEVEAFYDDGENDVDGLGWWSGTPTFGWMVAHYQGEGSITVTRLKFWFTSFTGIGDPIQVGLFADDGAGMPTFTPLGVVDATQGDEPLDAWREFEIDPPLSFNDGSFFVGARQIAALSPIAIGGDEDNPFVNNAFYYSYTGDAWTAFEPNLLTIPMSRCFVIGDMGDVAELAPAPVNRTAWDAALTRSTITPAQTKQTGSKSRGTQRGSVTLDTDSPENLPDKAVEMAELAARMTSDFNGTVADPNRVIVNDAHATVVPASLFGSHASGRDGGSALDTLASYRVYRTGTATPIATVPWNQLFYEDLNRIENTDYTYHVTSFYQPENQESVPSNTVTERCNMAPGVPLGFDITPVGTTQMRLQWIDPAFNADATPCTDLAGIKVYRDGLFLANVNAGVNEYVDAPPVNDQFYTWEVKAFDEVPNIGEGATRNGAVVSPWEVVDMEWVDISGVGTSCGITLDDQNVGPFNLGFNFDFFGTTFNSIRVCGNGFLSFTSTVATWGNVDIPNVEEPNNLVALFWDDMYPPDGGQIMYYADAANGRFIVSWIGIQHLSGTEPYTYQAIFSDGGSITFNYLTIPTSTPANTNCTVGLENAAGTDGIRLCFNTDGAFLPTSGTAVQFWGGPAGELTGIVRAFSPNLPIQNARVWAEGWADTVRTDALGSYGMGMDPGNYVLHVDHNHFCSETYDIEIVDGGTTVRNAILRAPNGEVDVSSMAFEVGQNQARAQTFHLSNSGGQCPLTFNVVDTSAWITVNPQSGTIPINESWEIWVEVAPGNFPVNSDHQSHIFVNYNSEGTPHDITVDLHVVSVTELGGDVPTEFAFRGNYPNPFNPATTLRFDVPQQSRVDLVIFNVMGQEVAHPVSDEYSAGRYAVTFDGADLPSGMYLVRMTAGSYTAMGKMMLLK